MLQRSDIELFYKHLGSLELKFPVADLVRISGLGKSTVSEYISRKKEPSENFLRRFYEHFEKQFPDNPFRENEVPVPEDAHKKIERINDRLMDMISDQLNWLRQKVDSNLDRINSGLGNVSERQAVDREVVYRSLAKLQGHKNPDALLEEANKMLNAKKGKDVKRGKQQPMGTDSKG